MKFTVQQKVDFLLKRKSFLLEDTINSSLYTPACEYLKDDGATCGRRVSGFPTSTGRGLKEKAIAWYAAEAREEGSQERINRSYCAMHRRSNDTSDCLPDSQLAALSTMHTCQTLLSKHDADPLKLTDDEYCQELVNLYDPRLTSRGYSCCSALCGMIAEVGYGITDGHVRAAARRKAKKDSEASTSVPAGGGTDVNDPDADAEGSADEDWATG